MRVFIFVLLFVAYDLYNVKGQTFFIGRGTRLYFALRASPGEWDWGISFCHMFGFMPGSIETEQDRELVTNFLNTTTDIEDGNRFLWLAANDHRIEGTFQWIWNLANVAVGSWAEGMPSVNRTANCLAINREGHFMEESCFNSSRNYFSLCEVPNFLHRNPDVDDIKINHFDKNDAKTQNQLPYQTPIAFTMIGQVGNQMYFADDQEKSWSESMDLCHSAEMRLATPEQSEQLDFIMEYAKQQDAIYYIAGTDRLSVSCLRSNSEFRWFYSGNPIANQTSLRGGASSYLCTCMSPEGLFATGCARGKVHLHVLFAKLLFKVKLKLVNYQEIKFLVSAKRVLIFLVYLILLSQLSYIHYD